MGEERYLFDVYKCDSLPSAMDVEELHRASKEKGCEVIKEWARSIKKHLYWCALSTAQGFGDVIVAKWTSIVRHVANKHDNHPNATFPTCAHEPVEQERKWIFSGSLAHDKLKAIFSEVTEAEGHQEASCRGADKLP
ncbi:uncharacterized protein LOC118418273 [Branchiostoma floridae]|uniref:Uncharacterized protein LOC118418273 n=1 Tax=Branchiostoma floridae TaxID=7739 RepID=A0A9J7MT52_BRAFL|nr:uncharacterized protein LOC118418273 [Branchiostoma floridae]